MSTGKKSISIVGGGPAALALAAFLDPGLYEVSLYEKNKTPGRKFLVAGDGGLNLSHCSDIQTMLGQYEPRGFLDRALLAFSNADLRNWLLELGIPTYEGSSHRIYPRPGIKPIQVLQAILKELARKKVKIQPLHTWCGWNAEGDLLFEGKDPVRSDYKVFALGGGSWKVTGSDGQWLRLFKEKGIPVQSFQASNCAFLVHWPEAVLQYHEGKPLKNIAMSCAGKTTAGEVVLTQKGLEGNALYALSAEIQKDLQTNGFAIAHMDFKPMWSHEQVLQKLQMSRKQVIQETLKTQIKLSPAAIQILKTHMSKEAYTDPLRLAAAIKGLPLHIEASAPLDEAISTFGGVATDAVDRHFQLKKMPGQYCIGEMLDWNAPTGGYLLQACFSMGADLAGQLNQIAE